MDHHVQRGIAPQGIFFSDTNRSVYLELIRTSAAVVPPQLELERHSAVRIPERTRDENTKPLHRVQLDLLIYDAFALPKAH